jgi:hypothetical protein
MSYHAGEMAPPSLPRAEPQAYSRHAVAQLLTLLSKPAADAADPVMDQPRKNAIWATFLMVAPPGSRDAAQAEARLRDVWPRLPGWAQEVSEPHAVSCSRDGAEPAMYCRWPAAFAHGTAPDLQPPGALVLDGVLPEVKAGMQRLMEADVPPPDEVGYEHANDRGDVDAEAEAAWLAAPVVVLTEAQAEFVPIWQAQGWTTVPAREAWEVAVQDKLKTAGAHS